MFPDLIAHSAESIKDFILRTSGTSRVSKADVQSMPYLSSKGGTAPMGVIAHGNDVVKKALKEPIHALRKARTYVDSNFFHHLNRRWVHCAFRPCPCRKYLQARI